MGSLSFQRQIDVMVRLRHRADAFDDRLPVLPFIIAVENISIGRAGENRVAAIPDIHRHAFDIAADVIRQPAAQHIP